MAATEVPDLSIKAAHARPGVLASIFASLAVHPTAPLIDASSEAAMSQPVVPRQLRLSFAWWRAHRVDKQARRAAQRLAETSPHLLRDIGLPESGTTDTGFERHRYGLRGDLY